MQRSRSEVSGPKIENTGIQVGSGNHRTDASKTPDTRWTKSDRAQCTSAKKSRADGNSFAVSSGLCRRLWSIGIRFPNHPMKSSRRRLVHEQLGPHYGERRPRRPQSERHTADCRLRNQRESRAWGKTKPYRICESESLRPAR